MKENDEIHSIEFHPDGLMLAAGLKNGIIKIYDIRSQQEIMNIGDFAG